MSIEQDSTLEFTASALNLLELVRQRANQAHFAAQDSSEQETLSLMNCLVKLILMGGRVYKESDTMLIANTRSGMTIGMHFDGKEWSLNS